MKIGTIRPRIDLETVKNSTRFELIIPVDLKEIKPPTDKELKSLREKVDPLEIRKLEVK